MPVLIVSVNTWPHEGFSRKRSMRLSESVTTMPNSSGLGTLTSPIVASVARDDEEGLVQGLLRELHRAGRAGGRLLHGVPDRHAERLAAAEVAPDRLRHERDRDDHVLEPVLLEELDDVLHAGLADDGHHRLRLVRRERAKARALAAGHDDRLHDALTVPSARA